MPFPLMHPDLTEKIRVPEEGPEQLLVEVGYWPPREDVRIRAKIPSLSTPDKKLDPIADMEAYVHQAGLDFDVLRDAVRWGVRGWEGATLEAVTVGTLIDDRKHLMLSPESIEALYHSRLLVVVGMKAILFNLLSEEERGKSGWRSSSSTSTNPTPAEPAGPESRNGVESSGLTARSSPAVPLRASPSREYGP